MTNPHDQSKDRNQMSSVFPIVLIGIAGALGALARYGVAEWTARRWSGRFPLATFVINISGAFALGLLLSAGGRHALAWPRAVAGTGFLGGYTTFSTLSYETHYLARHGHGWHARLNGLATLVVGASAAAAGIALGRAL
jgi:CrcB protein